MPLPVKVSFEQTDNQKASLSALTLVSWTAERALGYKNSPIWTIHKSSLSGL